MKDCYGGRIYVAHCLKAQFIDSEHNSQLNSKDSDQDASIDTLIKMDA